MMRYLKSVLAFVFIYLLAAFMINPVSSMDAVHDALQLCGRVVIPSLFPFFVCSRLLIDFGVAGLCSRMLSRWMRPLFGVPGCGALAVVLGLLSGYPIGAATVVNLYESGACTKTEGERLLTFCNNAGPLFLLGSIGVGMLHSQQLGLLLYLIHLLSAILTGLLFRKSDTTTSKPAALPPAATPKSNLIDSFASAISDGINNILKVCGFVVFTSVFCSALPWKAPLLHALLEITGGIQSMVDHSTPLLLPTISGVLALSGVSIFLQTASILLPSGLSLKPYLLGKLLQAILSFVLTFFLCRFLPISLPTFAGTVPKPPLPTLGQFLAFTLLELLVAIAVIGLLSLLAFFLEKPARKK